jgi:hypothetical protein
MMHLGSWPQYSSRRYPCIHYSLPKSDSVFATVFTILRIFIELLQAVLFAHIRFHDTVSRGRLLNRFGKDFEGRTFSSPFKSQHTDNVQASIATCLVTSGEPPFISSRRPCVPLQFTRCLLQSRYQMGVLTVSFVGGTPFVLGALVASFFYYQGA